MTIVHCIERAFEVISSRLPTDSEIDLIARLLAAERARFQRSPRNAERVIAVGEYPATQDVDPVEQAAWTQIATLLLNLSEVLTRQ